MNHAYIAYKGQPRGHGAWAAILQSEDGSYETLTGFSTDTTANGGQLEAAGKVLDHFQGEPVTIHTSLGYILKNLKNLDVWASGGWQITFGGTPLQNAEHWQRIYDSPGYPAAYWVEQRKDCETFIQARATALEALQEGLRSLGQAA